MGVGMVFGNHHGEILVAATRSIRCGPEVRVAEGLGLKLGLLLARDLCFFHIIAESDYLELINSLRLGENNPSYFQSMVWDYIGISDLLASCAFSHTKRDGNKVAYCLAKFACNNADCTWLEECRSFVNSLVILDCSWLFNNQ